MPDNIIFYIAFLSQIVLLSFVFPRKILSQIQYIMKTHPQEDYPKLYPKPIEHYEKAWRKYKIGNWIIFVIGLVLLTMLVTDPTNDDWAGVVFAYFMIQFIPMLLIEVRSFKYYQLMRKADSRTTRRAELQPRRLFNFISAAMLGTAVLVYFAFVIFVLYVRQMDFPWFGGYVNIVIVTFMNLFFAAIIIWNLKGKRKDPHLGHEDRMRHIELTIKSLVFTSIIATLFLILTIGLRVYELHHLKQLAMSLYLQFIAVITFVTMLRTVKHINFDVYKKDPVVT